MIRVLLADDSTAVLERITELLREVQGIELAGRAACLRETSRLIEDLHPDIVILDLQMPDGNAIEVLAPLKESRPQPIIIVLTNSAALAVRDRCLKTGADFFLDKSNEFDRIPQIVQGIVGASQPTPKQVVAS
jgi:DNA-binding NarL/FixJ family response regulator